MKAKLLTLASLVLFLFASNGLVAQDLIHLKNKKEPIQAKVVEIGTENIKYKLWEEKDDGLVYVTEKITIVRIVFENGRTEYFGQEKMDMEKYYAGQKRQALKISFLGPMIDYTSLAYEHSIKPGRSWEVKASIIGLGINQYDYENAKGFIGSFGYKLLRKPSFVTSDLRRRHILQGGYIKPELFLGHSSFREYFWNSNDNRKSATTFGFLLNVGQQWVMGKSFVLDLSGGIGYGFGESVRGYYVGESGLAGTVAIDIGFVF